MNQLFQKTSIFLLFITVLLLQGCGTFYQPNATAYINCKGAQCNELWSKAQSWIALNGDYKIQSSSDSFLQTHGPFEGNAAAMGYTITKATDASGEGRIYIRANCAAVVYGCVYDPSIAANRLFNHLQAK